MHLTSHITHSNGYAPYIAYYRSNGYDQRFRKLKPKPKLNPPNAHRSQIKICENRQTQNVQFRLMPNAFRILKPIQKSSKRVWVFRNTGANAFAKNQMRLAYEDKRDLYCITHYYITLRLEKLLDWVKLKFQEGFMFWSLWLLDKIIKYEKRVLVLHTQISIPAQPHLYSQIQLFVHASERCNQLFSNHSWRSKYKGIELLRGIINTIIKCIKWYTQACTQGKVTFIVNHFNIKWFNTNFEYGVWYVQK